MCTNSYCKTQHISAVVKIATAKHRDTTLQYSSAVVYKKATGNTATDFHSMVLQICINSYCKTQPHIFTV
jgi:hypothetical protein